MRADDERQLRLRQLLRAEVNQQAEPTRGLAAELARDPELAAEWERLRGAWQGLELPPAAPPPPGFGQRVMAHVLEPRDHRAAAWGWGAAPRWVQAAAAAASLVGVLLGVAIGAGQVESVPAVDPTFLSEPSLSEPTMAESYWEAMDSPGDQGDAAAALPSSPGWGER